MITERTQARGQWHASACVCGASLLAACGGGVAGDGVAGDGVAGDGVAGRSTGQSAAVAPLDSVPSGVDIARAGSAAPISAHNGSPTGSTVASTVTSTERIIPLDGDLAEIVFALGLGDQVVATDISATYPPGADALPEIGYQRALAPEPIAAFEPTIVLATDIAGPAETLTALDALGIEVVTIATPSTPDAPASKVRDVAEALGVIEAGEVLAASIEEGIESARLRAADLTGTPRVAALYVRGESVQLVLGEGSGVDWIIEFVGATDVADELGVIDSAPISTEALVAAAPDVFLVPERGLESVGGIDGLLQIPGLAETPAGRDRRVLTYDDQLLLGNGPRTPALLDELITDLHQPT